MIAEFDILGNSLCLLKTSGQEKQVSMNEFATFLSNLITVDESSWLPPNLVYLRREGGNVGAAYYFPERVLTMRWQGSTYTIKVPNAMFFFKLSALKDDNYKVIKMVAAIFSEYDGAQTKLYDWPFPNYALDYSPGFCWGDDALARGMYSQGTTLDQLPILYQRFFANEANNDLGWKMRNRERADSLQFMNASVVYDKETMKKEFRESSISTISSHLNFDFSR